MANKKKSGCRIAAYICLGVTAVSVGATIGYYVYSIVLNNKNREFLQSTTPEYVQNAFQDLDNDTKKGLLNSTYLIQMITPSFKVSGTAWSFHLTNDSWYLLTNYHVVINFLSKYHANEHVYNVPRSNNKNIELFRTENNTSVLTSSNSFFDEILPNQSDINNSDISIIADNQWTDDPDFKLFSDETSSNMYSLDMAMIKIKNTSLVNKLKKMNVNDPVSTYLSNKSAINPINCFKTVGDYQYTNNDIIIGGFPVRGVRNGKEFPTQYYMEVIKGNTPTDFNNNSFWSKKEWDYFVDKNWTNISVPMKYEKIVEQANAVLKDGNRAEAERLIDQIPEQWRLLQHGNVIVSNKQYWNIPIGVDGPQSGKSAPWFLSEGASGSPVYMVLNHGSFTTDPPCWAPIAIYWGGLESSIKSRTSIPEFFQPSFTTFISQQPYSTYNVYDNFLNLLNSKII